MEKNAIVSDVSYGKCRIGLFSGDYKVIEADDGFLNLTGYTREDVDNGTVLFQHLLPDDDYPVYMNKLYEVLTTRPEAFLEHRLQRKDGSVITVYCYGYDVRPDASASATIVMTDISDIKTMQVKYTETELELETLINNIPGGVAIIEFGDTPKLLYATDEFYRQLGHTRESYLQETGGVFGTMIYQADYNSTIAQMRNAVQNETLLCAQARLRSIDHTLIWLEFRGRLLRYQNGCPLIYTAVFDITESKRRDEALRFQTEQYQMVAEHTNELVFDYDVQKDLLILPKQYKIMRDGKEENTIPAYLQEDVPRTYIHPEDYERFMRELSGCLSSNRKTSVDVRSNAFHHEEYLWYRILCISVEDEQGDVVHLFGRMYSIDKIKRLKKTITEDKAIIERLSTTDPVTGLLNRATFKERAMMYLAQADPDQCYAMVYSDINDFSYVNDNFGYDSGNTMLFELGASISNAPHTIYCCRINSDFFLALVGGASREVLEREIRERDTQFWQRQRLKYPASELLVSTGICFIEHLDCDVTVEMDNANLARRKAKLSKGNPCCVYYDELRITRTREKIIAAELHGAIANRNVELFLQPKFLMDSREVIGAEALVRWRNADGSYRMPIEFIEILEKVGYIIELDFFMYEEVLKCLHRWKEDGKKLVPISVNFSRLHSNYANFVERVVSLAETYGVDSRYIEIEVTESAFASDLDQMAGNMSRLRDAGFSIDIDDFGKGYSSLSFLIGSPIDTVKVDKAFVDGIEVSEKHREYIKQMCMLIQATEKEIIFEGVETQSQADFLCECGFKKAQGWLLDKAVPVSIFEDKYLMPVSVEGA